MTWQELLLSGLFGALAGGGVQAWAMWAQTNRDLAARAEDREGQALDARLDRLELGVADLRAAALAVMFRVEAVRSLNKGATKFVAAGLVLKLGDSLAPIGRATTAIRINGENEIAAVADRILASAEVLCSEMAGDRDDKVRESATAALTADIGEIERIMRRMRSYDPLTDRDAPASA